MSPLDLQASENEMVDRFGVDMTSTRPGTPTATVLAMGDALQDYAERKMRAGIAALPDGTYRFEDTYDKPELGRALPVSVEVTIAGDEMRLHFDSPPQVRAGINMIYTALLSSYELVDGSGGPGTHRGGMGLRRVYRAEADCQLRVDGSRLLTPPWRLAGGEAGGRGAFKFSDGVVLTGAGRAALHPGDTVEVITPGAGGYGPPAARDPGQVARDVADRRVISLIDFGAGVVTSTLFVTPGGAISFAIQTRQAADERSPETCRHPRGRPARGFPDRTRPNQHRRQDQADRGARRDRAAPHPGGLIRQPENRAGLGRR